MQSNQRMQQTERPGAGGTDAVLEPRDHLAHEPDVQEHRQQQDDEAGQHLADDDEHDREVDASGVERVGGREQVHDAHLTAPSRRAAR
jgi:hypothetical protein